MRLARDAVVQLVEGLRASRATASGGCRSEERDRDPFGLRSVARRVDVGDAEPPPRALFTPGHYRAECRCDLKRQR